MTYWTLAAVAAATVVFYWLLRTVVLWRLREEVWAAHRVGQRVRRIRGLRRATACLMAAGLLLFFIVDFFMFVNETEVATQMLFVVERVAPGVGVFIPLALAYGIAIILFLVAYFVIRVEFTEPIHDESREEIPVRRQQSRMIQLAVNNTTPRQ